MEHSVPPSTGIADRLRQAREDAGLSNEQLAAAVKVNRKTVERWQTDGSSIKASRIFALAAALDVDPTWLLVGDHEVVA
jgi:transcriptional regulator with XRE-family HTH domain